MMRIAFILLIAILGASPPITTSPCNAAASGASASAVRPNDAAMERSPSSVVRETISSAWRDHIDAAIRKDLKAVLDIYADDIIYVVGGAPEVRGREAIAAMEARTLAEADVVAAEHTIASLRVFGDVAYELGTVIGPVRPEAGEVRTVTFHFMAMWRRQADGAWRIALMAGRPEEKDRDMAHHQTMYGSRNPAAPEELAQFDFLVGRWRCKITIRNPGGVEEQHRGTLVARYILDGYVIVDEYRQIDAGGTLVRFGATYRSFDPAGGGWVMKWHDALNSTWLDLGPADLGGVDVSDDTITFMHRDPPDNLVRITFANISDDRFIWRADNSADHGETWDEGVMVMEAFRIRDEWKNRR